MFTSMAEIEKAIGPAAFPRSFDGMGMRGVHLSRTVYPTPDGALFVVSDLTDDDRRQYDVWKASTWPSYRHCGIFPVGTRRLYASRSGAHHEARRLQRIEQARAQARR